MRKRRNSKGRYTKSAKSSKRRTRRRKRNGGRSQFHAARAAQLAHTPKRRKSRRKKSSSKRRSTKRRAGRRIRPTIIVARSGKYYRPKRSKYFRKPRRVNGKRRSASRRRTNGSRSIVAAIKNVFQVRTISRYASIGGGIFVGTLLSRMLNTGVVPFTNMALPVSVSQALAKVRPLHGLIHILAGTVIASKVRNKYLQDAGFGIAALGGFDILMQVLSKAGVMNLPTFSGMNVSMLSPGRMAGGMNVDVRTRRMAGMNVNLMGDETDAGGLADDLNNALS